jgi:hypothetical protein
VTEHEYWDEQAAGYALHGLPPDEQQAFVDHLETCEECVVNVRDHELVAAQLGSIAHYREPGDEVPSWESMRTSIVGDSAEVDPVVVDLAAARRRRYELSRRSLAAAAAVVLVAGGSLATWQLSTGGGSTCSATDGCHLVKLDAAKGKTLGLLTVRNTTISVSPSHMPAAPSGKVYVLWQVPRDAKATPISEFTAGSGSPTPTGSLKVDYADTQQFAISVETAGAPPAAPSNTLASGLAS